MYTSMGMLSFSWKNYRREFRIRRYKVSQPKDPLIKLFTSGEMYSDIL